jgi:hypothetical protein
MEETIFRSSLPVFKEKDFDVMLFCHTPGETRPRLPAAAARPSDTRSVTTGLERATEPG